MQRDRCSVYLGLRIPASVRDLWTAIAVGGLRCRFVDKLRDGGRGLRRDPTPAPLIDHRAILAGRSDQVAAIRRSAVPDAMVDRRLPTARPWGLHHGP